MTNWLIIGQISLALALLGAAPVFGTDAFFCVVGRTAAPVNAELTRHARSGSVPSDARALQARWDSVVVVRALLMGLAVLSLMAALVQSAR